MKRFEAGKSDRICAAKGDKDMRNTSRRIRRIRREKAAKAYRRRIFTRLTVMFAVLAAIATMGVSALTTAFARGTDAAYETVTVAKGDTLWDIAAGHNYSNRDVRAVVDDIIRVNNMLSTDIHVGDRINVPLN